MHACPNCYALKSLIYNAQQYKHACHVACTINVPAQLANGEAEQQRKARLTCEAVLLLPTYQNVKLVRDSRHLSMQVSCKLLPYTLSHTQLWPRAISELASCTGLMLHKTTAYRADSLRMSCGWVGNMWLIR